MPKQTDTIAEEIALKYWAKEGETSYKEICKRVAKYLANSNENSLLSEDNIFEQLVNKNFMPNSPVFMNAGTDRKSLAACFVLPVDDNMESIFDAAKDMALIMKEGGGVGLSLSRLRQEGSPVKHTKGVSSGPVSFLKVYNSVVETVRQGGTRRGAALANLRVDHPDIRKFIRCKSVDGEISNFNISVAITDKFMEAVVNNESFCLTDNNGHFVEKVDARPLLDEIIDGMWKNGEPGIQFIDTVNRLTEYTGKFAKFNTGIETSNPCSEAFLRPYESCILGAINLYNLVSVPFWKGTSVFNWEELDKTVKFAVEFLNKVIDTTLAPLLKINATTREARKIGLGVMGLADTLSALQAPYNSEEGRSLTHKILARIQEVAESYSTQCRYENSMITLVAPTGTTGLVANVSQGIEPHFRLVYERNSIKAGKMTMVCKSLADYLKDAGSDVLAEAVMSGKLGLLSTKAALDIKTYWPTADQISPEDHISMLAVVQSQMHNGVSKTINIPNSANRDYIKNIVIQAWNSGIKGITVYRDGSREFQVLTEVSKKPGADSHAAPVETKIEEIKRSRPITTVGSTTKVKIGCGNLYVTTNADDSGTCEVFTHLGRSGGCPSQSEATARLISLCLRSGIKVEEVSEQLVGIRCLSTIASGKAGKMDDGTPILSCPDAIGKCLKSFKGKMEAPNECHESTTPSKGKSCPKCSKELQLASGCVICPNCGYSKCG